jgi:sec-independent protein translocase protein TatC
MGKAKVKKSPDEMTFLEHLEDLRKRLIYSLLALFVGLIPGSIWATDVFKILTKPVTQWLPKGQDKLAYFKLTSPFMVYMKVAFLIALFVAIPLILLQVWYFVAPGLYQKEKKYVWPFVIFTSLFFALGALFGYFIAFPYAVEFFLGVGKNFQAVITIDEYFTFMLRVLLGIGAVFETPILIFFLSKIGIVNSRWMLKNFKYAILVVFIIAAFLTPTPDPINQTILALPMLALYSLGIIIAFFFGKERTARKDKRRAKKAAKPGKPVPA